MSQPDAVEVALSSQPSDIAVLDACVLFPAALRDALLIAAEYHLFEPLWSDDILEEVERNLVGKRKTTAAQAQRLTNIMRGAFPAATIERQLYAALIDHMANDPKDRHVVAAAIAGGASVIVTFNLTDFPLPSLTPYNLRVETPDTFFLAFHARNPDMLKQIFHYQASLMRRPPKTYEELLETLEQHMPACIAQITAAL